MHGAAIEAENHNGSRALVRLPRGTVPPITQRDAQHRASAFGTLAYVEVLVDSGANLDAIDGWEDTALVRGRVRVRTCTCSYVYVFSNLCVRSTVRIVIVRTNGQSLTI